MNRNRVAILSFFILADVLTPRLATAQGNRTSVFRLPFSTGVVIPCTGEAVTFGGTLNVAIHSSFDSSGGTHFTVHYNYQNVGGVDLVSGAKYRAANNDNITFEGGVGTTTFSEVHSFHLIGQGSAGNLVLFVHSHTTINANGDITAVVATLDSRCQ